MVKKEVFEGLFVVLEVLVCIITMLTSMKRLASHFKFWYVVSFLSID